MILILFLLAGIIFVRAELPELLPAGEIETVDEPLVNCSELGGKACSPYEVCRWGQFVYSDDYGSRCCVRGQCYKWGESGQQATEDNSDAGSQIETQSNATLYTIATFTAIVFIVLAIRFFLRHRKQKS